MEALYEFEKNMFANNFQEPVLSRNGRERTKELEDLELNGGYQKMSLIEVNIMVPGLNMLGYVNGLFKDTGYDLPHNEENLVVNPDYLKFLASYLTKTKSVDQGNYWNEL